MFGEISFSLTTWSAWICCGMLCFKWPVQSPTSNIVIIHVTFRKNKLVFTEVHLQSSNFFLLYRFSAQGTTVQGKQMTILLNQVQLEGELEVCVSHLGTTWCQEGEDNVKSNMHKRTFSFVHFKVDWVTASYFVMYVCVPHISCSPVHLMALWNFLIFAVVRLPGCDNLNMFFQNAGIYL